MLVGTAAFAVINLGHLFVTDLLGLIAVRVFLGAAEALFFVAGFAMLADIAPAGRAGEALSYASLALSPVWRRVPRWPRRCFGRQASCRCGERWPCWPGLSCSS